MNGKSLWSIRVAGLLLFAVVLFGVMKTSAQGPEPGMLVTGNAPSDALALPPFRLDYQGYLLGTDGTPVDNMSLPMTFKIFNTLTGGTACWIEVHSGANAVNVDSGRFDVLLGQITAIDSVCLTGDDYLELIVNGETLTPRQRITSMASHAIEAGSLSAESTIYGNVSILGSVSDVQNIYGLVNLYGNGMQQIHLPPDNDSIYLNWHRGSAVHFGGGDQVADVSVLSTGIDMHGNTITQASEVKVSNPNNSAAGVALSWYNDIARLRIGGDGAGANNGFDIQGVGNTSLFRVYGNGDAHVSGNLTCGGYIETNLQTPEEQTSMQIERFTEGDLMCWEPESGRLEHCTKPNDRLVMAVADPNGKPIVMGAEFLKVLGPVRAGEILVSSDKPGYAMVNNNPAPGTVIGQALQDFEDESGLIKAMIRKW